MNQKSNHLCTPFLLYVYAIIYNTQCVLCEYYKKRKAIYRMCSHETLKCGGRSLAFIRLSIFDCFFLNIFLLYGRFSMVVRRTFILSSNDVKMLNASFASVRFIWVWWRIIVPSNKYIYICIVVLYIYSVLHP